jgi:tRNA (guanine-N7-)-methyltransferase
MIEQGGAVRPTIDHKLQRSYGRVNGRKLRAGQQALLDALLPEVAVSLPEEVVDLPSLYSDNKTEFWLEIGFGGGEHLAYQAQCNPDVGVIGCEPFTNGVVRLLRDVEEKSLKNVRIFHGDARLLLEKISDGVLDKVFILFPDPWPKAKHYKKRFIQSDTLSDIARLLKKGGLLRIATDHVDYSHWIHEQLQQHVSFVPESEEVTGQEPDDWCVTRYQQKAKQQGRGAVFFDWICQK